MDNNDLENISYKYDESKNNDSKKEDIKKKNKIGCLKAFALFSSGCLTSIVILILLISISIFALSFGCTKLSNDLLAGFNSETITVTNSDALKVMHIKLDGIISIDSEEDIIWGSAPFSAASALKNITLATDEAYDGIILQINSPGGSVTDSDIIWNALMHYKNVTKGKVVVHMGDMATSGGYYIAAAADHIIASPTTITGSIGVILSHINCYKLLEKIGVTNTPITSGKNKDILNPLNEINEEQRALVQEIVDEMFYRFISIVASGRKMSIDEIKAIADGRIMTASKAKECGLIDEIGYYDSAEVKMHEYFGNDKEIEFIEAEEQRSLKKLLSSPSFIGKCFSKAFINVKNEHDSSSKFEY